jgi:fatty acid desaturase
MMPDTDLKPGQRRTATFGEWPSTSCDTEPNGAQSIAMSSSFSMAQSRAMVADLFVHRPHIYWCDFLVTTAAGYASGFVYVRMPVGWPIRLVCFLIAGFALFRSATFIHEIVHMRQGVMPRFKLAWNLLFGVPALMPSLLYSNHLDHHRRRHYGTAADGEYLPFAHLGIGTLVRYFGQILLLPFFAVARFLVIGPLSYLHPPLRRWTLERFSSYSSNFRYRRVLASNEPYRLWLLADLACFLCIMGLIVRFALGLTPWTSLVRIYVLAVFVIGLNWLRNLAGHHFRNDGEEMSVVGQLLDSVTVTGHPVWTEVLFPLGLRYHALHHLFPSLPYHSLGVAHRRLMAQLPPDSAYHQTIYPTLFSVLRQLWSEMRRRKASSSVDSCGETLAT